MEKNYIIDLIEKSNIVIKAYNFMEHPANYSISKVIPDFDVLYTISGQHNLTINDKKYVSKPGDVFILTPNTILTLECSEFSTQFYCHFSITSGNGNDLNGTFNEYQLPSYCCSLASFYKIHFNLCTKKSLPLFSYMGLIFKLFLIEMLNTYKNNYIDFTSDNHNAIPADILQTLNYIHEHLHENITIDILSEIAGFNTSYFCRYFKKYMGVSPMKYINNSKMDFAKYFISTTNKSLKEISFLLGFADQFTFSKKFKEYYGISPSEFRKVNI